jgi:hypothetical protein
VFIELFNTWLLALIPMAAIYGLDLSKRIGVTDLTGQERARTGVI